MNGWIKLHRNLLTDPIWFDSTPQQKVVLITLLLMANHSGKEWVFKGKPYKANPGQFVTSLKSIQEKCGKGVSIRNIRTSLERFEKFNFLTSEPTNKNRLITIVKWDVYQTQEEEPTNELTFDRQATDKQLTTNKNVKNIRKKEYKNKPPVLSEVISYFTDKGFSAELAKQFFEYYSAGEWHDSKGNPVKNWKQKAISQWFKPKNQTYKPQNLEKWN